ncbi:hypothetical protein [Bacillus paralicheniformis]|uniref:Uncharacterized protein n=3 Tax=Bacillus paralicheniformis TaxID=1648923 RepID=A0ABY3FQZ1_9BACI|nr:hypothetical protein [Bacillus paralicheniformis]MED1145238.1 hypothetical protein [Bacillus paralicheniformis]MED1191577.1 hypothetical protein [Bacillus paralicheniformis]TWK38631.1 hypothetical protein CHCC20347_3890 [Bacillus paralicheniformis]TWL34404.1 hypothetical protein CHCC15381_4688 [Bacillus paralicheniformis]WEZ23176.1 hypothetical protein P5637_17350 [Bacillus paralicheniformis]
MLDSKITLTTQELVAALLLCRYEKAAEDIIHEQQLIRDEKDIEPFSIHAENLLKQKGHWDDDTESNLKEGLESIIHLLVQSKRKVRCTHRKKEMIIHHVQKDEMVVEEIEKQNHSISILKSREPFLEMLKTFYHSYSKKKTEGDIFQMDEDSFDEFHEMEAEVIKRMAEDPKTHPTSSQFSFDFLANDQELDNISFFESDSITRQSRLDQVVFLLRNDNFIWHLGYENIKKNGSLYLQPVAVNEYFEKIVDTMNEFFDLEDKGFLFKFSFEKSRFLWLRSNFILLLLTALLLLNKPYWEKDANVMFFMFVFTAELFIILLSLVYGFQTKKTVTRPPSRAIRKTNIPIGIFVFSIFSLFFGFAMSGDIPYPNSALIIYLTINMVFAFVSLFVPTLIIKLYETNVYDESNGLVTDFFRYVAILVSSLNYEVQIVLARLPFVLQRLMGVIFIAALLWELTMIGLIFENN